MSYCVIILEDNKIDAQLMKEFLMRSSEPFEEIHLVFNKSDYMAALQELSVDLIIADYRLSGLNGTDAIELKNELKPDVPIIIVSATIGEEKAVELIKAGASDFLIKNNLKARLAQVCIRALEETKIKMLKKLMEDKLEHSLIEKNILLMEIHHRVKNNLALISAFMQLQAFMTEDERIHKYLNDNHNRIKSIAIIHDQLYENNSLTNINLKEIITNLVDNIFASSDKNLGLKLNLEDVMVNINQAVPFSLMVNEIVTYIQDIYEHDKVGAMDIILKSAGGKILLEVLEQGYSLSEKLKPEDPNNINSLIIKTLSEQLDGKLNVCSGEPGTVLTFNFQKNDNIKGASSSLINPLELDSISHTEL